MHNIWFIVLIVAWGLGSILAFLEIRGSFAAHLIELFKRYEGIPAVQLFCVLSLFIGSLIPVLLWPVFVLAELFIKPEENEH